MSNIDNDGKFQNPFLPPDPRFWIIERALERPFRPTIPGSDCISLVQERGDD